MLSIIGANLFSRTGAIGGNKSSLAIDINGGDQVFSNGDFITGLLTLNVASKINFSEVVVYLHGVVEAQHDYSESNRRDSFNYSKVRVFPTDQLDVSRLYTLTEGIYTYPFSIAYPLASKNEFLPPTFEWSRKGDFARVYYTVSAEIVQPSMFKSNIWASHEIKFIPENTYLAESHFSNHLCYQFSRVPVENTTFIESKIKFQNQNSLERKFLKRMMNSSTTAVPILLSCQFKPHMMRHFTGGQSNRFIQAGTNLPEALDLRLISPLSPISIKALLQKNLSQRDQHQHQPLLSPENIVFNRIVITLHQSIVYRHLGTTLANNKLVLLDKTLEHKACDPETDLSPVPSSTVKLSAKSIRSYGSHLDDECYQFALPHEWYNVPIPRCPPSFVQGAVEVKYHLGINLTISSSGNLDKSISLKNQTPIVVLHNQDERDLDVDDDEEEDDDSSIVFSNTSTDRKTVVDHQMSIGKGDVLTDLESTVSSRMPSSLSRSSGECSTSPFVIVL
ncbi:hypothetical protein DASC09_047860 [Saccharomycopsis crataegensis]|uniref:Arrestin-like N-terminal domain-containing protein n=1 Tax=Saccharomycopsis crataegensis TaxID=43959 RepID=A0AAV5QSF8_9ASCO|nr:hypothetical protein DASC09_047860 [Saccharomycopsis crataegensis]